MTYKRLHIRRTDAHLILLNIEFEISHKTNKMHNLLHVAQIFMSECHLIIPGILAAYPLIIIFFVTAAALLFVVPFKP